MGALSADKELNYKIGEEQSYPVAEGAVIFAGAMVCLDTDGYAVPAADTADYQFVGFALERVDNANGLDGDLNVRVRRKGSFLVDATSIAQSHLGSMMFIKDDQTVDNTSSNLVAAGKLVEYISATKGRIDIEPATRGTYNLTVDGHMDVLGNLTLEDGTALTIFSAAPTPGWAQLSNKERVLKWDNHATPAKVAFTVSLPEDLDDGEDVTVHILAAMSGTTDTPDMVYEAYFDKGDTDCAGADPEIAGGVTVTEYVMTIAAADVPAGPCALTIVANPKDGQLGTDEVYVYAWWVEFKRKNVT